ncbi:MAG: leucyl aminopeptidase, partial [Nocardioidaceae bacterium]|nr:leucyl aminopeptidase [Nocardioidaceae bacterium]
MNGVEVVALPVLAGPDGPELGPGAADLLEEIDLDLFAVLETAGATGSAGEVTRVPVAGLAGLANPGLALLLLVGVGAGEPADLRRAGAGLGRAVKDRTALATSVPSVGDDAGLRAFVEGLVLGSFEFHLRSEGPKARPVEQVIISADPARRDVLARALVVAGAGWRARALATVPSNIKSPQWFVEQATELVEAAGLGIEVLDETDLEERGFGGIAAVGRASATPPRLLVLTYEPPKEGRARSKRHVVLAGKGITFDSGGLSIKPGELMVNMKRDMTGAAVVLAVMAALREVGCPVRVTALLALAENVISGDAMRPGDVITHYGGRTTEVTNTDAEGRLVLADCLAYAAAELKPDLVVDVATLTGAIKVALGQRIGGIFGTDDALVDLLRDAGQAAGEPLWRMPLADVYEERLSSKIADSDNATTTAQAISAALFLQHFTGGLPWAHLDIASVGDAVEDAWEWTAGPTGYGPRALLYWLEQ